MEKSELTQETGLKVYEVGYLLVPTIAEEQVAGEVQGIKSIIEKQGGSFISEDFPALRQLTYTMARSANGAQKQKFDKAYFGWIKFEAPSEAANTIKNNIDRNPSVLRLILVNTVRENTISSPKIAVKAPLDGEKVAKPEGESAPINEDELNKSIENLVV
jgi:ribosomal protein S6